MTGAEVLAELLERIGASRDGAVFIHEQELREWPIGPVAALKSEGLLAPAAPASSVTCPGCERQCVMPVHTVPGGSFVLCDKHSYVGRVPVETDSLVRWLASGEAVAAILARLLKLRQRPNPPAAARRWEVGRLKAAKNAGNVVLRADGELKLEVSGHSLLLADVLSIEGRYLALDTAIVIDRLNNPAAGGGDAESAEQRRDRLLRRLDDLKGTRPDFFRAVALEEGISRQRLRQIIDRGKT